MGKYKSAVNFPFTTPFLEGEVVPGKVYDLPATQPDGSELVWPAEFWTAIDPPAPVVAPVPPVESE